MKINRKKNENSQLYSTNQSSSDNENDSDDKDYRSRSYATLGQLADQIHMKAKANMLAHGYEDDLMDYDDESVEGVCTVGEEHTGRWTREEHSLFLEGLKKFGKEWKKVAAMVRTRTVVQTRTHAQKYFQKLSKGMGDDEYMEELELKSPSVKTKSIKKNSKPDLNLNKKNLIINYEEEQESSHPNNNNQKAEDQSSLMTPIQNNSISIIIPQSSLENFPQPSPAACGKRKEAELAAAKILASTSSHEQDAEDAQLLSKIKEVAYRPGEIIRKRKLGLSIINPEEMEHGLTRVCEPSTPWESEVKALEEAIVPNVEKSIPLQVSTPYEQNDLISKLTEYIMRGDTLEIKRSLSAIQGTTSIKTVSGLNNLTPMSPPTSLPTVFKFEPNSDQTGDPRLNTLHGSGENNMTTNFDLTKYVEGDNSSHQTTSSSDPTQLKFKIYENCNNKLSKILNKGETPKDTLLFIACSLSKEEFSQKTILEICRILIDHGSNPCLVDKNVGTCLHLVASQGIESVGRLLLNRGCSANEIDGNGNTALHIAAKNHHTNFLELLVDFGANCHIRNFVGRAALDILDETNENKSTISNEKLVKRNELRRVLLSLEPRLRTLILYHDDCLDHIPRRSSDWEAPDRIKSIMRFINDSNNFQEHELEITSQFDKAPVELLSRVHSPEYITFVDTLSKQLQQSIGSDTFTASVPFTPQVQRFMQNQKTEETKSGEYSDTAFSTGTLNAARRAAGAVAHAVDRVLLGRNRNAFCVVRPPGHHAGYNGLLDGGRSCGFCIFNSVAAGAFHALEYHNCERVAIIDLDIHHGNGTEDIVRRYTHPSRLFFFSVHLFEKSSSYEFFPGTGADDDAAHNIVNVPIYPLWAQECMPLDSKGGEKLNGKNAYRKAISQRLLPSLRAFNPSLILLSSGFDASINDVGNSRTIGSSFQRGMDMLDEDFKWVTSQIMSIADICCNGKIVSVLEGGYGHFSPTIRKTRSSLKLDQADKSTVETTESDLNRHSLASAASSHVRSLIDPFL